MFSRHVLQVRSPLLPGHARRPTGDEGAVAHVGFFDVRPGSMRTIWVSSPFIM